MYNIISIPNMYVESSAFDLNIEGTHSFTGAYGYHVKVLLSDFLSRRESAENEHVTEFGIVEDDGLGRTSLFLKIEGDRSGSKVSHDMDALRTDLKEDLTKEKLNLRGILKEEYGWYENDSLPDTKYQETRKFRIVWEEADSISFQKTETSKKRVPLKRIFRKKKDITGDKENF